MQTTPKVSKTAIDWYENALALYNLKKYNEAIVDLLESLELNPNNSKVHHLLGLCYHKIKDYKLSIRYLNSAISLNKDSAEIYVSRGNVFFDCGLPDKAILDYSIAISINRELASAYYGIARATKYTNTIAAEQVIKYYTIAISLPNNCKHKAYNMRGIVYDFLGKYQNARDDFSRALQINPGYTKAYENLARLLIKEGQLMLQELGL